MNRIVVITGGTRGIGRAIAEHFLELEDSVAVCSRSDTHSPMPDGVLDQRVDVRDRDAVAEFQKAVITQWGRLDVWVNAAGVSRWKPIAEVDQAFADEVLASSLMGTLWGCAVASEALGTGGAIVNVSSLAGKRGSRNNSVYCAAKFAVNGITQSLAKELGAKGIRVNAVCPVYVETDHIQNSLQESTSPAAGQSVGAYLRDFAQSQTALQRLPTAQEVAETVAFLASEAASAVTGQCINVDCGTLPQ